MAEKVIKKQSNLGIPLGNKTVPGVITTYTDGTAKWTYINDTNPLVAGFGDRSTFTLTKSETGKWSWSPTTDTSVKNLSQRTGLSEDQITSSLYKTPQTQTALNGANVLNLGGITEAKKIEGGDTLPGAGGSVTNPDIPVDQTTSVAAGDKEKLDTFLEELNSGTGFKKNTRESYTNVKYPLNLRSENQDCIKFSIIKYKPPGVKPGSSEAGPRIVSLQNANPTIKGRDKDILATITLPIPSGIGDRNSADWQGDTIKELQEAFASISIAAISGGGTAGAEATGQAVSRAQADSKSVEAGITAKFAELATGATNILSRQYGAVVNPNLELLFTGPSLRSFTFNFRFTPRDPKEAQAVRSIIRQFKQAMSVKRSASSLLLRAPHTFAISYLSNNKDHPYLNRFKECALTDCSVNYTPDGTYMTYTDSSMTAYELSLTFQELEPIFDDEYYELDKNSDTSIGF